MSAASNEPVRRRVIFHGRVQGVCFRATARDLARGFAVTGFVRNLADGTVELQAQGDPGEIDRFCAAIHDAFTGFITHADSDAIPPVPGEERFEIRF